MLQFVTIDSICFGYVQKGAVARHRNPVVQFDLDMSKRSSAKIVQGNQRKIKQAISILWQELSAIELTSITISKSFMLNSFFLELFVYNMFFCLRCTRFVRYAAEF